MDDTFSMRLGVLLWLYLLSVSISNCLASESCTDVNLQNKFGPVRNQGSLNWCYAYALADLIGVELGYKVSGADIAISHNNFSKPGAVGLIDKVTSIDMHKPIKDSGPLNMQIVFDELQKAGGVCPEKILPSDFANDDVASFFKAAPNAKNSVDNEPCSNDLITTNKLFSGIPIDELSGILKKIQKTFRSEDWYALAQKNCARNRIKLPDSLKLKNFGPPNFTQNDFLALIDQKLDSHIPVGAGISTVKIRKVSGLGYIDFALGYAVDAFTRKAANNVIATHALSVIGRHYNKKTNTCEYLLRNSTGANCDGIQKERCFQGNIIVSKEELRDSLQSIFYITR